MLKLSNRVKNLLNQMTLDEKITQLLQVVPAFYEDKDYNYGFLTGPLSDVKITDEAIYNAGSALCISDDADENIKVQKNYLEKNRLEIPLLFMADIIHGFRTAFPIPLGLACAFDPTPTYNTARVSAKEAAAAGVHITYSPMLDLSRDPRWGRVMEGPGECPYIGAVSAKAWVEGYQGTSKEDLMDGTHLAATLKHFVGYGMSEGGRDYDNTDICENTLKEIYLRAFKAGIDAGAELVMAAFCTFEGIPCHASKKLLKKVLRQEMGFEGVIISDWGGINDVYSHTLAADIKEAAMKSINAGIDIDLMGFAYQKHLKELIEEGLVSTERLDNAVALQLMLKEKLGLFDNPYRGVSKELTEQLYLCDEHRALARDAGRKSCVLLKNDNILPFKKDIKSVAVIGPNGGDVNVNGGWTSCAKPEESVKLFEGVINAVPEADITVHQGCEFRESNDKLLSEAVEAAKNADIVILALGEPSIDAGECKSRTDTSIPAAQIELARAVCDANKNVAVVLMNGRPLVLGELNDIAPAILESWFLGSEAGNAIADILFGDYNPTGRLAMTFLRNDGQVPTYYNRYSTGRPNTTDSTELNYTVRYADCKISPLYSFGHGLSYTTYEYSNLEVPEKMTRNEPITVRVNVKNTGDVFGVEPVQLYIRDVSGSVVRPLKELKGIQHVSLNPGQSKCVEFEISDEMLKFYDENLEFTAESGEFRVMIGHDSNVSEFKSFVLS